MQPTYVTFAQKPASTANAVLSINRGTEARERLKLDADGSVEMTFDVPAADANGEATLGIVALVCGNTGTVAFTGPGDAFVGTYQRVGEGAIGYRGRSPAPTKGE
ncbi:hypothetical protein [Micromonospora sp. NPDC005413]|uniref:hypothetical protein n=1 Tax=Micromonospora sp. NPDC005413 TaxID=3154563 RepID=UPI0033AE9426